MNNGLTVGEQAVFDHIQQAWEAYKNLPDVTNYSTEYSMMRESLYSCMLVLSGRVNDRSFTLKGKD